MEVPHGNSINGDVCTIYGDTAHSGRCLARAVGPALIPAARTTAPAAAGGAPAAPAAAGGAEIDCSKIQSDIKIGLEGSLTGGTADYGQGMVKGFQLAIQEYNVKGGYQGKPVGCAIYDDATKAETGQENVSRLINQDKVVGIVGPVNSGVTLGFSKQIQETGIPLIVSVATGTALTKQFPAPNFIFRVSMADINQTGTMLAFAKSKGWAEAGLARQHLRLRQGWPDRRHYRGTQAGSRTRQHTKLRGERHRYDGAGPGGTRRRCPGDLHLRAGTGAVEHL